MLKAVAPFTAKRFGRAIVMPNLAPEPVTTTAMLKAYQKRVDEAIAGFPTFTPLMTYTLNEASDADDIAEGFKEGVATAVKAYPLGVTTNSQKGFRDMHDLYPIVEKLQEIGMPLLLHGEQAHYSDGTQVDQYDKEKTYIENVLIPLLKDFPNLKVVLEHASTKEAVDVVTADTSGRLGSTVTVQHLMLNRTDMFDGGLQPHLFCHPIIKRAEHQQALRRAVTSGDTHFFLGTDSAPHPTQAKERATGCAGGVFTAPAAIELYAQVFDEEGKIENLEKFASLNGPKFYDLTPNEEKVTLEKSPWTIDAMVEVENGDKIRPFGYHEDATKRLTIGWKLTQKVF